MTPLVVVAPAELAAGFALGGAEVRTASNHSDIETLVENALTNGAHVVAVHHQLWTEVPASTKTRWEASSERLVIALPPDDGTPAVERAAELHELLARAVGYEISFTPGGES